MSKPAEIFDTIYPSKTINYCVVIGKRWFDRKNGNTYHSYRVVMNGEEIGYIPFAYGYDEGYRQTVFKIIQDAGYWPKTDRRLSSGFPEDEYNFFNYIRDNRDKFTFTVSDVSRKKDL